MFLCYINSQLDQEVCFCFRVVASGMDTYWLDFIGIILLVIVALELMPLDVGA